MSVASEAVGSGVAPRAGAWIETASGFRLERSYSVAPRAGAWIETWHILHKTEYLRSRPARARGLKQQRRRYWRYDLQVAPRAGAWIETPTPR